MCRSEPRNQGGGSNLQLRSSLLPFNRLLICWHCSGFAVTESAWYECLEHQFSNKCLFFVLLVFMPDIYFLTITCAASNSNTLRYLSELYSDLTVKRWQGLVIISSKTETSFFRCFWLTNLQRQDSQREFRPSSWDRTVNCLAIPVRSRPCYFQRTEVSAAFWGVGNRSRRNGVKLVWILR